MSGFHPVDPKQSFPELEERVLERWRTQNVFQRSLENRADAPLWSFYEGPPTANGKPGSHHVLSRVFKDIYPRYKTMTGHRVPRKAGWDCHGLPVELEVEKELGISSKAGIEEFGIAEFNARCRESVFRYVSDWNKLTERIGFWLDLDDPYVTMTDDYIESVWWALRKIWDDDRLYEGHKVVPYCPRCGTALSSHEVALGYKDVTDPSVYAKFPLLGDDGSPAGESLLVWTTTPWTLPGNVAIAVAADVTYARVEVNGETLILAEALIERVLGEGAAPASKLPGSELVGRSYSGPIFELTDRKPGAFPIIRADFVTTDDGTGLVHLAPAFGQDDFDAAVANGLLEANAQSGIYNPVRLDGTFDERVSGFEGRFVKDPEVTAALIAKLDERGSLFKQTDYEHAYPHCWRCDTPLLYYAKASWYVRTTDVRETMLKANRGIGWHPEHIRDGRFGRWLEGNIDWALSRDRYWGTPLPIWECQADGCDHRFCAGSIADITDRGGSIGEDLHRPHIDAVEFPCDAEGCDGTMRRVPAVIDTWFDSGAMPFAQFHYPFENTDVFEERFPADFICEAIDQTRGWFYTLLAESSLLFGESSYRNCVCLGLILDPEGQKMSKTRGNVVAPWDVIDIHGADAFRWYYFTAQQPWNGYRFSVDTVGESVRQFLLTLWNTYGFWVLYANSEGLVPEDFDDSPPTSATAAGEPTSASADAADQNALLDAWALSRLQGTIKSVRASMEEFDCTSAGRTIAAYVDELSNWYVRLNRRRFWDGDRTAFATLRHCLLEVTKLLAPFTPFLTEEIYRNLAAGDAAGEELSVHLSDFPEASDGLIDAELEAGVEALKRTVELGRAARAQAKVKMRQPLRRAVVVASEAERRAVERLTDVVAAELNVKDVEFVSDEAELVSYRVKPNYRTLGPRFGKSMPLAADAIEALDAGSVAATLRAGGHVGVSVDGAEHELGSVDLSLVMEPLDGYEVEAASGHAVALSVELDDELRAEGLAREVVRAVQNARKEAGLEVSDRITLALGGDDELIAAARANEAYVAGEVLAEGEVTYEGGRNGAGSTASTAEIEGRELTIALKAIAA